MLAISQKHFYLAQIGLDESSPHKHPLDPNNLSGVYAAAFRSPGRACNFGDTNVNEFLKQLLERRDHLCSWEMCSEKRIRLHELDQLILAYKEFLVQQSNLKD